MRRNCRHVERLRCGAGGIRSRFSTRRTVEAPTRMPEAEQLALDPLVAPARVLPRHLLDQHREPGIDRRPAAAVGIGPPPADQPPVPAQQRVRRHQPAHPQRPGEQPGQGGEHRPVGPVQLRLRVLPPQHRHLLAQHQQLGVLRRRRTCQQRHPAGQADEDQVEHPYRHKPAILPAQRPPPQANPQVSHLCPVLEPHRLRGCWWSARWLGGFFFLCGVGEEVIDHPVQQGGELVQLLRGPVR